MKKNDKIVPFPGRMGGMGNNAAGGIKQPQPPMMQQGVSSDPQMTIEVKNEEAEKLLAAFTENKSNENLTALVNHMVTRRVLVPAKLNENKQPMPMTIKDPAGQVFQPVFTSKQQIPAQPQAEVIMNIPFLVVVAMVLQNNERAVGEIVEGVAINPFSQGVMLRKELLTQIKENESKKAEVIKTLKSGQSVVSKTPDGFEVETRMNESGALEQSMKMSANDYFIYERIRFERTFLPKKMFEEGQAFVETLAERRAQYIDELYEESYENKRMYPYLTEEFQVMPMNFSEELELFRIQMPAREVVPGIADTALIAWNKSFGAGRYFIVVHAKDVARRDILEILGSGKIVDHGIAPEEGSELTWVMSQIEK